MSEPADEIVARAGAVRDRVALDRGAGRYVAPAPARRKTLSRGQRLAVIGAVNAVILIAATAVGLTSPLGMFGALAVLVLMAFVTLLIGFAPARAPAPPSLERLRQAPLAALPAQTGHWLAAQRPALPAPAVTLVDRIGVRLETLGPQLAALHEEEPAAAEIRKLVGEQLPDFIRGYAKVPPSLRTVPRNGRTPDTELVDGLTVIERQIGDMSAQLAQGDLDSLATRGRYLEIKYSGEGAG